MSISFSQFSSGQSQDVASCRNRETSAADGLHDSPALVLSIVIPCYNEEDVFPTLQSRLVELADQLQRDYLVELILVDDGSRDSTWRQICDFAARDKRVLGAKLARNFGHQAALTCGYELANGNAVVCMDADLQDPPEVVLQLVEKWRMGADVVYAVRKQRIGESLFKRSTAKAFYQFMSYLGAKHVRPDTGDFRLMSRRALSALLQLKEQHRFLRGMVGWIGFPSAEVAFDRPARASGVTKYPLRKMVSLAADAVFSFSRMPLRLPYYFALILSAVCLAWCALAAMAPSNGSASMGTTGLVLIITAFGAANLLGLAILGEYVGRTYEQSKNRPVYLLQEVSTSKGVMNDPAPSVRDSHVVLHSRISKFSAR